MTKKQRARRREVRRNAGAIATVFMFLAAFLVDGWHGLSLTRLLAIYFAKMAVDVSIATRAISGNAVVVVIFCLAAAFGKGVFAMALARWRGSSVSNDTTTKLSIETIRKAVDARREAGKDLGVEASL